ncbi:hypothetical protein ACC827_26520 [Rhizobium ruizarguesonis]
MTDATTAAGVWAVLLPVLVGGGLTIVGGLISPFVQHALTSGTARDVRRADRFNAMLRAVYEMDHWLDNMKRVVAFGEAFDPGPSPMHNARSIVLTDFPELRLAIRKLDLASSKYQQWMGEALSRRVNGENSKINEGFPEAYKAWASEFHAFENEAAEYSTVRKGKV